MLVGTETYAGTSLQTPDGTNGIWMPLVLLVRGVMARPAVKSMFHLQGR